MAQNQQVRKILGITRVLMARPRQREYLRAGWAAARTVGASAKHATRLLWLQVTGFFFAFFAVIGALAAFREYQRWHDGDIGLGRCCLAAVFGLAFAYFAITSFVKAKQLEKERANVGGTR